MTRATLVAARIARRSMSPALHFRHAERRSMGREETRLAPLASQIAIDQVGAVAHPTAEARAEFLEKRQMAALAQPEKRPPRDLEHLEELRDGVAPEGGAHADTR